MVRWLGDGGIITPYIPIYVWGMLGVNGVFSFPFSDSHVSVFTFRWNGGWPCTDGAHQYGGRPSGLPPQHPSFLGLRARSAEQWSSAEALSNQLPQVITYHRYASLHGTSSLETGVVLCPHVSGLHQDRKSFHSLFMIACFASF